MVGFDKHPRGAFVNKPEDWSLPGWYGAAGMMVTTQFFGMKIKRYLHDHEIPVETLARSRQGLPQRRAEPERVAADGRSARTRSSSRRWSRTR